MQNAKKSALLVGLILFADHSSVLIHQYWTHARCLPVSAREAFAAQIDVRMALTLESGHNPSAWITECFKASPMTY